MLPTDDIHSSSEGESLTPVYTPTRTPDSFNSVLASLELPSADAQFLAMQVENQAKLDQVKVQWQVENQAKLDQMQTQFDLKYSQHAELRQQQSQLIIICKKRVMSQV